MAKKVMVGNINMATGEQKPDPYTPGEGVTDPDGNALLTDTAGGGSPVSGLKNATVIASGSFVQAGGATGKHRITLDSVAGAFRFYWGSGYCVSPAISAAISTMDVQAGYSHGRDAAGVVNVTRHELVVEYYASVMGNTTFYYKVYRIDEA